MDDRELIYYLSTRRLAGRWRTAKGGLRSRRLRALVAHIRRYGGPADAAGVLGQIELNRLRQEAAVLGLKVF